MYNNRALREMTVLANRIRIGRPPRDASIPHPPRRVPLRGDVLAFRGDEASQSAGELAELLGPIYEFAFTPAVMRRYHPLMVDVTAELTAMG